MLRQGITGFFYSREMFGGQSPLPCVEKAEFKKACYFSVQHVSGQVKEIIAPNVTPNFYRAPVEVERSSFEIRGHTVHRIVAFSEPIKGCSIAFIDRPDLETFFLQLGFEVLSKKTLDAIPSSAELSALEPVEREQVKHWQAKTNGEIAFHWFD